MIVPYMHHSLGHVFRNRMPKDRTKRLTNMWEVLLFASMIFFATSVRTKESKTTVCEKEARALNLVRPIISSSIILHGRIMGIAPNTRARHSKRVQLDAEINAMILVVATIHQPEKFKLPAKIVVKGLVISAGNGSHESLPIGERFGCLEYFHPNAKYTFFLKSTTGESVFPWSELPVFDLAGYVIAYSEEYDRRIVDLLCKDCCEISYLHSYFNKIVFAVLP